MGEMRGYLGVTGRPDKRSASGNLALPSVSVNQVTAINPAAETEPAAEPG